MTFWDWIAGSPCWALVFLVVGGSLLINVVRALRSRDA